MVRLQSFPQLGRKTKFWLTEICGILEGTYAFQVFWKNLCQRRKRRSLAKPAARHERSGHKELQNKGGPGEPRGHCDGHEPWPSREGGRALKLRVTSGAPGQLCKGKGPAILKELPGLQEPEVLSRQPEPESWQGLNPRLGFGIWNL